MTSCSDLGYCLESTVRATGLGYGVMAWSLTSDPGCGLLTRGRLSTWVMQKAQKVTWVSKKKKA